MAEFSLTGFDDPGQFGQQQNQNKLSNIPEGSPAMQGASPMQHQGAQISFNYGMGAQSPVQQPMNTNSNQQSNYLMNGAHSPINASPVSSNGSHNPNTQNMNNQNGGFMPSPVLLNQNQQNNLNNLANALGSLSLGTNNQNQQFNNQNAASPMGSMSLIPLQFPGAASPLGAASPMGAMSPICASPTRAMSPSMGAQSFPTGITNQSLNFGSLNFPNQQNFQTSNPLQGSSPMAQNAMSPNFQNFQNHQNSNANGNSNDAKSSDSGTAPGSLANMFNIPSGNANGNNLPSNNTQNLAVSGTLSTNAGFSVPLVNNSGEQNIRFPTIEEYTALLQALNDNKSDSWDKTISIPQIDNRTIPQHLRRTNVNITSCFLGPVTGETGSPVSITMKADGSNGVKVNNMEDTKKTTMMLRNLPNKTTQAMLLRTLDSYGYKGKYDFFYLPIDFKNRCSVGYCFINFTKPEFAAQFQSEFHKTVKLNTFNSPKVCEVNYARVQGYAENVEIYRNSPVMSSTIKQYKPLIFDPNSGDEVPFPSPDAPLPKMQVKKEAADRQRKQDSERREKNAIPHHQNSNQYATAQPQPSASMMGGGGQGTMIESQYARMVRESHGNTHYFGGMQ